MNKDYRIGLLAALDACQDIEIKFIRRNKDWEGIHKCVGSILALLKADRKRAGEGNV